MSIETKSAGKQNAVQQSTVLVPETMISIASLQAVQAVSLAGSMSGAATTLGRSQSAVSQLVSQAEEVFGRSLFDRTRRPFLPTQAGRDLLGHAARILKDLTALPTRMAERNQSGSLRIAMIDSIADTLGAELIRLIAMRGGDLFVSQGLAPAHINDLLERRVDIVVSADSMDEYDGLSRFSILSEKFVKLVPEHKLRHVSRMSPVELIRELPFIRYTSRSTTGAIVEKYLRMQRVPGMRRIEVENADMMCALVGQGVGWALTTPLHVLQGVQYLRGVAVVPIAADAPQRLITIITREGEFEETAATLAQEAKKLLTEKYIPELLARVPVLANQLSVPD